MNQGGRTFCNFFSPFDCVIQYDSALSEKQYLEWVSTESSEYMSSG